MNDDSQTVYNYQLPLEVVHNFTTRWNAIKSLQEFANYIATMPGTEEIRNIPNLQEVFGLIAEQLGTDMGFCFQELIEATTAAIALSSGDVQQPSQPQKPGLPKWLLKAFEGDASEG